jgi:hypothetical protein
MDCSIGEQDLRVHPACYRARPEEKPMRPALLAILAAALAAPVCALADDVVDQINDGLAAYKAGKYSAAASELEFALQGVRQKQAEQLKALFPAAPAGWEADEVEVGAAGMAMMGGGIGANRDYRKKVTGDAEQPEVEISIVGESPLLQTAVMWMSNPMMAGAGAKQVKLGAQRGFLRQEKGSAPEITVVVANKLLVTVKGSGSATEADVTGLAKALDYGKLEKLVTP